MYDYDLAYAIVGPAPLVDPDGALGSRILARWERAFGAWQWLAAMLLLEEDDRRTLGDEPFAEDGPSDELVRALAGDYVCAN